VFLAAGLAVLDLACRVPPSKPRFEPRSVPFSTTFGALARGFVAPARPGQPSHRTRARYRRPQYSFGSCLAPDDRCTFLPDLYDTREGEVDSCGLPGNWCRAKREQRTVTRRIDGLFR
jgi:hypothetical protein